MQQFGESAPPASYNAAIERRQHGGGTRRRIRYMHALGEATQLPAASFDLVTISFVIHEVPPHFCCHCRRRAVIVGPIVSTPPGTPGDKRTPPAGATVPPDLSPAEQQQLAALRLCIMLCGSCSRAST